jgi:hypothetical protein
VVITSVSKRCNASAKNSSDVDKIAPPSEALDNSGSRCGYKRTFWVKSDIRHLPTWVGNGFCEGLSDGKLSHEDMIDLVAVGGA